MKRNVTVTYVKLHSFSHHAKKQQLQIWNFVTLGDSLYRVGVGLGLSRMGMSIVDWLKIFDVIAIVK